MNKRKAIIPLLLFIAAVIVVIFGYSFAMNTVVDHSDSVVVTEWNLIDANGVALSNTHQALFQDFYTLDFSWELTAPSGTTLNAGDTLSFPVPTIERWYWSSGNSSWTNFHENDTDTIIGMYRLHNDRIEVVLNSSVNGRARINARFITGRTMRNYNPRGGIYPVTFGGITRPILFRQDTFPARTPGDDHGGIIYSSNSIRWMTAIGVDSLLYLADNNQLRPIENVFFEQVLTGNLVSLSVYLPLDHPVSRTEATPSVRINNNLDATHMFTRVHQSPGEAYQSFRSRLRPLQYGVFTSAAGETRLMVNLGTIGNNGLVIQDIDPQMFQSLPQRSIDWGVFDETDRVFLQQFYARMYGRSSAAGGEGLFYRLRVIEGFPNVDEPTVRTSRAIVDRNGTIREWEGTGLQVPNVGAAGDLSDTQARVYLHDEQTNVPLDGVEFRLQIQDVHGQFIMYPSWNGGRTGTTGGLSTDQLGLGTYRFIQMDKYSDDYDLTISEGFFPALNTVVSDEFTITGNEEEPHILFVTNTKRRRCITYVPGDCGTFDEQRTCDLLITGTLPEFVGTPSGGNNCVFDGWDEEEDANRNITRTARWRRIRCVTYLPGECGVFTEQRTCNLPNPGEIPEFNGTPDGGDACEFDGWNRGENEDGDITYTARWNRRNRSRVFLNAEDTGELLSGVPFVLQRRSLDGLWLNYPNWSGGDTNEYGYLTTPYKGAGVYRFVQRGIYSDDFDLSISRGFDSLLMTVISNEFTIESDDAEGSTLFVTNARRRFCVTYRPGDCGVFEEQETCDVMAGGDMPEFTGTPEGEYICDFDGWDRIETEDGDIIYTARWNRRPRVPNTFANMPISIYIISGTLILIGTSIIVINKRKEKTV